MRSPTCLRHEKFRRACGAPDRPAAHRCRPRLDPLEDRLCLSDVSFGPAVNWPVAPLTQSVAVADFNEDGRPDLAVVAVVDPDAASGTVSVLLGNGSGGFTAPVNFATGRFPVSAAVSDFNGDGHADLAVANNVGPLSVLLGDGTGNFGRVPDVTFPDGARSVAVGDFNGDGRADLAVANELFETVSVFLGNGSGGFAAPVNFGVGGEPWSVAVADLNDDGRADLAVANLRSGTVSVLLGDGTGNFGRVPDVTVGDGPVSVAVNDFNGDGRADLAVANNLSDTVSVLLGNANGGFAIPVSFAVGREPWSVVVADFDDDGRADLAMANNTSGDVSVLRGNGSGGFAAPVSFAILGGPYFAAVGDFNGDDRADLAVSVVAYGAVAVLLNTTPTNQPPVVDDQSFGVAENSPNGTLVGTVAASDPDAGGALSYQITAGNTGGAFALDGRSGQITVDNRAALDFETTPVFTLTVKVSDNGSPAESSTAAITIRLNDVVENPQSSSTATQAVAENSTQTFSGAAGNDINDLVPDTGAALVQVSLRASHGRLTLAHTAGLKFQVGDGKGDRALTFRGTSSAVKAALKGLRDVPVKGYAGTDRIAVAVKEPGSIRRRGRALRSRGIRSHGTHQEAVVPRALRPVVRSGVVTILVDGKK
jgi:hypothetical protein